MDDDDTNITTPPPHSTRTYFTVPAAATSVTYTGYTTTPSSTYTPSWEGPSPWQQPAQVTYNIAKVLCEDCNGSYHDLVFKAGRLTAKCPKKEPKQRGMCLHTVGGEPWTMCKQPLGFNNKSGLCRKHRALEWAKKKYHEDPAYAKKVLKSNAEVKRKNRAAKVEAVESLPDGDICATCGGLYREETRQTHPNTINASILVPGCCLKPEKWVPA